MARERLSRRHAAAHLSRRFHRLHPGRAAERHEPVRGRHDRLDARRRADVRHPVVRDLPGVRAPGRHRHDRAREQLHAVRGNGRRLHDRPAHLRSRGLHVDREQAAALAAHAGVQRRAVAAGRARGVPDEAPVHQRRAAAVPAGAGLRRGARHALHRRCGRRAVQGARARRGRRRGRVRDLHLRRELHEVPPGPAAGPEARLEVPARTGPVVLRPGRQGAGGGAAAGQRGHPPGSGCGPRWTSPCSAPVA